MAIGQQRDGCFTPGRKTRRPFKFQRGGGFQVSRGQGIGRRRGLGIPRWGEGENGKNVLNPAKGIKLTHPHPTSKGPFNKERKLQEMERFRIAG